MTGARVPLAGVIGHPVGHSLSPVLHGHWLRTLGIRGHYVPLDVAAGDLAAVLATLPKAGFMGANVTIPHKEAARDLADRLTERAARIGAVNTLTFSREGGVTGDCTDGAGFVANLRDGVPGWTAASGPVGVFGAGGAARAIVDALIAEGAPEVRIANRTRARAEALADLSGDGRIRVADWDDAPDIVDGAATVVNTTALGMAGQPPFAIDLAALSPGTVATDIVYAPLETPFLAAARARGARCVDGLGMLLHQAVPGFEAWFGQRPEVTPALRDAVLSA